jgi:hypothetical protein
MGNSNVPEKSGGGKCGVSRLSTEDTKGTEEFLLNFVPNRSFVVNASARAEST